MARSARSKPPYLLGLRPNRRRQRRRAERFLRSRARGNAARTGSTRSRRDWSQNRRREPRGAQHDAPEHEAACVESRYGGTAIRASLSRSAAHGSVAFRYSRLSSSILLTDCDHLACRVCRTVELTRRRESKRPPPHRASCERRYRRSRPTIVELSATRRAELFPPSLCVNSITLNGD